MAGHNRELKVMVKSQTRTRRGLVSWEKQMKVNRALLETSSEKKCRWEAAGELERLRDTRWGPYGCSCEGLARRERQSRKVAEGGTERMKSVN